MRGFCSDFFDLYSSSQFDICCLRQSKSIKKIFSSISGESFFVDGVFTNQAWSSHHTQSNFNLSNIQPKKREYCNNGDALTWNPHDDAKHPLGSFECKSAEKKRRVFCIGNQNYYF
jgi:hypothetical protein